MIGLFNGAPFTTATEVDQNDFFTGNGVNTTFDVINKPALSVGAVVQTTAAQYFRYNSGFSVNLGLSKVTLATAPANLSKGVIPGINKINIRAYDQAVVPGVTNPNIGTTIFYVADPFDIGVFEYLASVGFAGISVQPTDHDTGGGAAASWIQLAPMLPDGTEGTYGAPGAALNLGDIKGMSTVSVNFSSLSTSITVADGTQFVAGNYIAINVVGLNYEIVRVTNVVGNVLTILPCNSNHLAGEVIYQCGWGAYAKLTLPTSQTGVRNWLDVSLDMIVDVVSRS